MITCFCNDVNLASLNTPALFYQFVVEDDSQRAPALTVCGLCTGSGYTHTPGSAFSGSLFVCPGEVYHIREMSESDTS